MSYGFLDEDNGDNDNFPFIVVGIIVLAAIYCVVLLIMGAG